MCSALSLVPQHLLLTSLNLYITYGGIFLIHSCYFKQYLIWLTLKINTGQTTMDFINKFCSQFKTSCICSLLHLVELFLFVKIVLGLCFRHSAIRETLHGAECVGAL